MCRLDEGVEQGVAAELGYAFEAEFGGDVLAVGEDGVEADVQALGDVGVALSGGDKAQHVAFAAREHVGWWRQRLCVARGAVNDVGEASQQFGLAAGEW